MVTGWRRAFCTSIPKDTELKTLTEKQHRCDNTNQCPNISSNSKFTYFPNPSTATQWQSQSVSSHNLRCRTSVTTGTPTSTCSVPNSPKLQCSNARTPMKHNNSPSLFKLSNPFSPNSPSSFSLLKSSLRLSKNRCGICMQNAKAGKGTAIFTAECSHIFHFPCISAHVKMQNTLICPVCSNNWNELPVLPLHNGKHLNKSSEPNRDIKKTMSLKVYNDDEPLGSPTSVARFNPIPESEENEQDPEEEQPIEFQGFNVNPLGSPFSPHRSKTLEVCLLPEAAIAAANRSYETHVVVLKVKAPPSLAVARRAPMDLVAVLDLGGTVAGAKLQMVKRSMRFVISSLVSNDRLSIVAFSAGSKRLLPLRRMNRRGQRAACRIVDAFATVDQCREIGAPAKNDALKKAAKVLEDRRQKNSVTCIVLLSDGHDERITAVSSTRLSHHEIPIHALRFMDGGRCGDAQPDAAFANRLGNLLSVVAQDVRLQLSVASRSVAAEIAAVYSVSGCAAAATPCSARIGDLCAAEERELLVEFNLPTAAAVSVGSHHFLSVQSSHRDPFTQELVYSKEHSLLIPRPYTVRSLDPKIERLRNLHVTIRAVAESRWLVEHDDLSGALRLFSSARAMLKQWSTKSAEEYLRRLEAEQAELLRRRQQLQKSQRKSTSTNNRVEDKLEPLTPTSAWRAAEKLAKLAIMKKSMNRVSDLHGFENARF